VLALSLHIYATVRLGGYRTTLQVLNVFKVFGPILGPSFSEVFGPVTGGARLGGPAKKWRL